MVARVQRRARVRREIRIRIERERRAVHVDGRELHLTPLEYKLLTVLAQHRGAAVSATRLVLALWGPDSGRQPEHLNLHVRQLRHKLERDPSEPRHLLAEPGVGFRLRLG